MKNRLSWQYDEMQHIGVNFADPKQVEEYDAKQHSNIESEARLVSRLGVTAAQTVLEFGPGTGNLALAAAEKARRMIAVDISMAMLDMGRARAAKRGTSNINFVHAGFLTYEHVGEPVDLIVTQYAFHHLPEFWKTVALSKMVELLKPGGRIYLEDVVFSFPPEEYESQIETWINSVARSDGSGFSRADFEMHVRNEYSTFGWAMEGHLTRSGLIIENAVYESPVYANFTCRKP